MKTKLHQPMQIRPNQEDWVIVTAIAAQLAAKGYPVTSTMILRQALEAWLLLEKIKQDYPEEPLPEW